MIFTITLLCIAAFAAGFVDAVVGGGGLIQLPAALIILPNDPVSTVIGTLKIPSFTGTAFAFVQYARKVSIQWKITALMCALAFICSYTGSYLQTLVSNTFMKPVLLIILTGIAIYTYTKKDFGNQKKEPLAPDKLMLYSAVISIIVGLYDGFIGPGAGSFLILAFISILRFDFLQASAHAKVVNLATNSGSIILFFMKGKILWVYALPMALCNALGGLLGARLALLRGNTFIRVFFLVVIIGTLIRFAYDVFMK
jgi:hypothetical protein